MISENGFSRDQLLAFLLQVQKQFLQNDIVSLRTNIVLPLVVYTAAGILLIRDEEGFLDRATRYLQALHAENIRMSECLIKDVVQVSSSRFHATVRWKDFGDGGKLCSSSLIRYFMIEDTDGRWKIEMMEFVEMPITVSQAEHIIH